MFRVHLVTLELRILSIESSTLGPVSTEPRQGHFSNSFHGQHQVSPNLIAELHANILLIGTEVRLLQ